MPSALSKILAGLDEKKRQQQFKEFRDAERGAMGNTKQVRKTVRKKEAVQKKTVKRKITAKQVERKRMRTEQMRLKAFKKRQANLPKRKLRGIKTASGLTIVIDNR